MSKLDTLIDKSVIEIKAGRRSAYKEAVRALMIELHTSDREEFRQKVEKL